MLLAHAKCCFPDPAQELRCNGSSSSRLHEPVSLVDRHQHRKAERCSAAERWHGGMGMALSAAS
jgi:hypothetical protein